MAGHRTLVCLSSASQAVSRVPLDVKLSAEELGRLDMLTKPTFSFPQSIQPWFSALHNGGTSVNGVYAPPTPFELKKGEKSY